MAEANAIRKYEGVRFRFFSAGEDDELTGTVLARAGEMVLDIPGGYGPYLIVGRPERHWFGGSNSARLGTRRVEARWVDLGDRYVGRWVEEETKYLFSFTLPGDDG